MEAAVPAEPPSYPSGSVGGARVTAIPDWLGRAGEQEAGVGSDLPTIPEAVNQPWEHHRPSFGQGIFLDTLDEILRPASTCIDCLGKVRKSCCRVCFPVWERWFVAVLIA